MFVLKSILKGENDAAVDEVPGFYLAIGLVSGNLAAAVLEPRPGRHGGKRGNMQRNFVQAASPSGLHGIAYTEWGAKDAPAVVCVHGMTGNARNFDILADALSSDFRVICPDVAGRGESDWLPDPMLYAIPQYVADMVTLIARLNVESVQWVGASMGGLIGMTIASLPNNPISRLVVNDIGPMVPRDALIRIASYLAKGERGFDDLREVEEHFRSIHAPFGALTDDQWAHFAKHGARKMNDGRYRLHYDRNIAISFNALAGADVDIWPVWDAIACPSFVIRGAESDLLLAETCREMEKRGPKATIWEVPETGHAPALMDRIQIQQVREWLVQQP